jgi:hypothetical protein
MKMETVRDVRNLTAVASVAILLLVSGCGGGGSNDTTFTAANEQPVTVGPGPFQQHQSPVHHRADLHSPAAPRTVNPSTMCWSTPDRRDSELFLP